MSAHGQHHALPPGRERTTLLMLAAVQFTHMVDFMIMVPLGEELMRAFSCSPAQFARLVASYGFAAAIMGLAGGFVLDRFDRKRSLLVLYAGFVLTNLACALAPNYHALLLARTAAGIFGGLAYSMVIAMVGDIIPPERRGRAMSWVAGAFPLALVLGVPLGLFLAGRYGWHSPFYLLAGVSLVNLIFGSLVLPHVRTAVHGHEPLRQMREIVSHGIHLRAFAVTVGLGMAGGLLIPFIAPSFVANLGISQEPGVRIAYEVSGVATAISMPIVGWLTDRTDRWRLLMLMSIAACICVSILTRLGPTSLVTASGLLALFTVTMSGRFTPAMTMITNAVEPRYRGGFMSVNSALQQAAVGAANVLAGVFVTRNSNGHLDGMPMLGNVAIVFFILTIIFAARLRAAAPHVSTPAKPHVVPIEVEA